MRTCWEWLPLQLKEGADNQEVIGGGVERVDWGEDAEGAKGVGRGQAGQEQKAVHRHSANQNVNNVNS